MKKPKIHHITGYSICIPLTVKEWDKLRAREIRDWDIHHLLEPLGADKIDFNGHFGQNFFFSAESLEAIEVIKESFFNYLNTPLKDIPKYYWLNTNL